MIIQHYADIVTPELLAGAIENNEYHGFKQDYHVLWCLLRKYQPTSLFEVGTNMGRGTNIICHAIPDAKVYSLDLPTELAHISLQHPINEGHGDRVGHLCKRPYIQLRGDSMTFDYAPWRADAYFIDGEHTKENVRHETFAIKSLRPAPSLIIWHDADIQCVWEGILEGLRSKGTILPTYSNYEIYRVIDTRIAYAVKKGK